MFTNKGKRYTEEFKIEAVKQVTERGHSVCDVADRLGIAKPEAELKRVKKEWDMRKKAAKYFAGESQ